MTGRIPLSEARTSRGFGDGKIVAQGKARKVMVFKYKRRKDSKKKKGHRQAYTELVIEKIQMEATHGA